MPDEDHHIHSVQSRYRNLKRQSKNYGIGQFGASVKKIISASAKNTN